MSKVNKKTQSARPPKVGKVAPSSAQVAESSKPSPQKDESPPKKPGGSRRNPRLKAGARPGKPNSRTKTGERATRDESLGPVPGNVPGTGTQDAGQKSPTESTVPCYYCGKPADRYGHRMRAVCEAHGIVQVNEDGSRVRLPGGRYARSLHDLEAKRG